MSALVDARLDTPRRFPLHAVLTVCLEQLETI